MKCNSNLPFKSLLAEILFLAWELLSCLYYFS